MSTPLNLSWLQKHQMPISSAFAAQSSRTGGTVADYIREHLGYRLELTTAQAITTQDITVLHSGVGSIDQAYEWKLTLRLQLVNRGFSAPVNHRVWAVHLLDLATNRTVCRALAEPSVAPDWRSFYPVIPGDPLRTTLYHVATLAVTLPNVTAASYWLGFSLVDPLAVHSGVARHAVRFTNTEWMDGANVVGSIGM